MFGVNRPVRFGEDCRKENTHRQPSAPDGTAASNKRGATQLQSQDPLRADDQPERGYVESMDQAFSGQIQDVVLTDRSQPTRPSPLPEKPVGEAAA